MPIIAQLMTMKAQTRCLQLETYLWLYFGILGYYRICGAIIASYRKYEGRLVDLTCRQCLENRVFTYKKFEAILKNNYLHQADDEPSLFAPVPTDHANMRGNGYFK